MLGIACIHGIFIVYMSR